MWGMILLGVGGIVAIWKLYEIAQVVQLHNGLRICFFSFKLDY